MSDAPPRQYTAFTERFPDLADAWTRIGEAGRSGPLDARTARLVKLALAIGTLREGAVHAAVRKARSAGATPEDFDHVIRLAAGTIGFPATVAAFTWVQETLSP